MAAGRLSRSQLIRKFNYDRGVTTKDIDLKTAGTSRPRDDPAERENVTGGLY